MYAISEKNRYRLKTYPEMCGYLDNANSVLCGRG